MGKYPQGHLVGGLPGTYGQFWEGRLEKYPMRHLAGGLPTARCVLRGLGEGDLAWLPGELGNSNPVVPTLVGRENASVRAGGRRRRSSQPPSGNGRDRVKVRQGKLNKMIVNRGSEESRCWQLYCWCTWRSSRLLCPTRVVRPNWKAECVERRPLRLEGGKDCKVLPILTWVGVSPPGYPVVPRMR